MRKLLLPPASALLLALALLLPACGTAAGSAGGAANSPRARSNSDILRSDEIAAAQVGNAYEALLKLRPRFLAARGQTSLRLAGGGVRVVVDGYTQRGIDDLRNIPASDIVYIRHLSASEATIYWGTGFTSPVIYVLTRAGPGPGARVQ